MVRLLESLRVGWAKLNSILKMAGASCHSPSLLGLKTSLFPSLLQLHLSSPVLLGKERESEGLGIMFRWGACLAPTEEEERREATASE